MEKISSSEFRRRYATLPHPVVVMVNGRPIGVWDPRVVMDYATQEPLRITATEFVNDATGDRFRRTENAGRIRDDGLPMPQFRDFRPVPKPSQKGK